MKICLHTNWEINQKYIGGTERFLINLSKELEILGHEPFIVCSSKEEETYVEGIKVLGKCGSDYKNIFAKYESFSSNFLRKEIIGENFSEDSLKRLSDFTQGQLDGINADVFHLNSFISASYISSLKNIIVTNHENNKEYDWYWGKGFFNLLKTLVYERKTNLHEIKGLFTPSKYYANFFSSEFNLKVEDTKLGIPLNYFKYEQKESTLKEEYDFNKNDIVLLLPSRFQPFQKGHDVALEACSILKEKRIPFKIIFTGVKKSSERYRSSFNELVSKYGLEKHIKVITFADINEAYRNVDIVISPERYCSYGLSISESLSLGIPTILSDIPTYREIADGYAHASFFKSESGKELAEKIINAMLHQERNQSEAVRFRCSNDIRDCAKKYTNIYQNYI
ncbi:glycosyltransferase involved in cell wall biosynthesis [Dysgonomonas sp. PFB1-18]|uniref:glycosyltransferase family 4 protein n=1 Tax=unclassified Dysgonomonas TaxID=2630389 RepID=UPI0013D85F6B|nr:MULTISPECIES: glycosyltransferase family 4 protein [unclassified Dysgonomonas]MDH6310071.1 glycosyltransferase involved in cell wall biosynthesis [Dysgonomonas sp. PF1-14]MDH6339981.1 glycosyltransferase involved in cell wall biosynthesis [Dysgonomonas sp. PF1-16]MDH6381628.1 glycosyltransferase involved in cell wall biosynthesis [Dysgonomonas sp. PFB1-18]MDH6398733.1 glycosyltransferase involved in cell wall biosynthesis [Dysgonomonas sp. PF1-23]NDV93581.1 glycosyltransferase [Dysgonomonas